MRSLHDLSQHIEAKPVCDLLGLWAHPLRGEAAWDLLALQRVIDVCDVGTVLAADGGGKRWPRQ